MRNFWLVLFTSCIPLNSNTSPDSVVEEPSAEPESAPEGLTLNINSESEYQYGHLLMTGWHLVFDGHLVLHRYLDLGSIEQPIEEEFSGFLSPDSPWGFGVTLAPSNEDVSTYMYGVPSVDGMELALFEANNHSLTLQFDSVDSPDCGHGVVPRIRYRSWFDERILCEDTLLERTDSNSLVLCASGLNSVLDNGFQMVFWHRPEHDSEKVQMWIDNTKFIFENFTFNPDCASTEENELSILFGKGAQYQSDVGITTVSNLYGRMDNLVIFKTEMDLVNDPRMYFWPEVTDTVPSGAGVYEDTNFMMNLQSDDGFGWWSFEQPDPDLGPIDSNVAVDFSPIRPLGTNNLVQFLQINNGELDEISPSDARTFYRNNENNTIEEANWSSD